MKSTRKLSLATATLGAAAIAAGSLSPLASAATNPFGVQKLDAGYQLAQADTTKAGDKKKDASCGSDKKKDGSCGGDKKK